MSIREIAYDIFDNLTENQLKGFILMFRGEEEEEIPNEELLEAFAEVEEMQKHPDRYKSYSSAEEMVADILGEDNL